MLPIDFCAAFMCIMQSSIFFSLIAVFAISMWFMASFFMASSFMPIISVFILDIVASSHFISMANAGVAATAERIAAMIKLVLTIRSPSLGCRIALAGIRGAVPTGFRPFPNVCRGMAARL